MRVHAFACVRAFSCIESHLMRWSKMRWLSDQHAVASTVGRISDLVLFFFFFSKYIIWWDSAQFVLPSLSRRCWSDLQTISQIAGVWNKVTYTNVLNVCLNHTHVLFSTVQYMYSWHSNLRKPGDQIFCRSLGRSPGHDKRKTYQSRGRPVFDVLSLFWLCRQLLLGTRQSIVAF